jgi:dihydroxy-acid dehydratase
MVGHVAPEAARGGPIGKLQDGDTITIDVESRRLDADIDFANRTSATGRGRTYPSGALAKYAFLVSSASHGAVTSFPNSHRIKKEH